MSAEAVRMIIPEMREVWDQTPKGCAKTAANDEGVCQNAAAEAASACLTERLWPALRLAYKSVNESGVFIDVGAHVGHWTAKVLSQFGDLEYRKYAKEFGAEGDQCSPGENSSVLIYCLEPAPKNAERLGDRAKRAGWQMEGFKLMRAAVSNESAKVDFWAKEGAVDPEASFAPRADTPSMEAKTVTLDLLLRKSVTGSRAFLVKLSMNGYEHQAIQGAKHAIKKDWIKLFLMQVTPKWQEAGYRWAFSSLEDDPVADMCILYGCMLNIISELEAAHEAIAGA